MRGGAGQLCLRPSPLGLLLGHLVVHPRLLPAVWRVRRLRVLPTVALVPAPPVSVLQQRESRPSVSGRADSPHGSSPRFAPCRTQRHPCAETFDDGRLHRPLGRNTPDLVGASRHRAGTDQRGSGIEAWRRHRDPTSIQSATSHGPRRDARGSFSGLRVRPSADTAVVRRFRLDTELGFIVGLVEGMDWRSHAVDAVHGRKWPWLLG